MIGEIRRSPKEDERGPLSIKFHDARGSVTRHVMRDCVLFLNGNNRGGKLIMVPAKRYKFDQNIP
jgi:hypothetical protein